MGFEVECAYGGDEQDDQGRPNGIEYGTEARLSIDRTATTSKAVSLR